LVKITREVTTYSGLDERHVFGVGTVLEATHMPIDYYHTQWGDLYRGDCVPLDEVEVKAWRVEHPR
jgi:hypothetical protein